LWDFGGVGALGDLGLSRFIGLMTAFLEQGLAAHLARPAAVAVTFTILAVVGLWTGSLLAGLVDDPTVSRDVAACGLYMVTGAIFWRLLRARG
jgi:hypothetical protein